MTSSTQVVNEANHLAEARRIGLRDRARWFMHGEASAGVVAVAVVLVLLYVFFTDASNTTVDLVFRVALWAALASAWNLIGGFGRQLSLGHAAFFGLGAYGAALAVARTDVPALFGGLIGALIATLLGVVVGLAGLRLRGPFFAMVTFVMGLALETIAVNLAAVTGGSFGLPLPIEQGPWYSLMYADRSTYLVPVTLLFVVVVLVSFGLRYSRLGLSLIASQSDLEASRSLGINVFRVRVATMALSAFLTALAGMLTAMYVLFVDPANTFGLSISITIVFIALIGGLGTLGGPLLGAMVYVPLDIYVSTRLAGGIRGFSGLVLGTVLFAVVMLAPNGLVGAWRNVRDRIRGRRRGAEA